jgi:hypothetical protein
MSSGAMSLSTQFVLFRAAKGLVFSYFVRAGVVVGQAHVIRRRRIW